MFFNINYNHAYLVMLSFLVLLACQKEIPALETPVSDPILPPLTHEGKNTFGCLIDGEPFVAEVDYAFAGPVAVWAGLDEETGWFRAQGTRELEDRPMESVGFIASVGDLPGQYDMKVDDDDLQGYFDNYENDGICWYYHDLNNKGTVEITYLDTLNDIISGKFEMELINPDCPTKQSMSVTDGRFDIRY